MEEREEQFSRLVAVLKEFMPFWLTSKGEIGDWVGSGWSLEDAELLSQFLDGSSFEPYKCSREVQVHLALSELWQQRPSELNLDREACLPNGLTRFLYEKYEVPGFLLNDDYAGELDPVTLVFYIAMTQGFSPRRLLSSSGCFRFRKTVTECIWKVPDDVPADKGIDLACLMSFGFSYEVAEELNFYDLGRVNAVGYISEQNKADEAAFKWCLRNINLLRPEDVRRLLGYIRHIFWEEKNCRGFLRRSYARMLRGAHDYDEENRRMMNASYLSSEEEVRSLEPFASDSMDFTMTVDGHTISFVQLFCLDSLKEEGETLKHCVGSYAWKCGEGKSTIVSMRRNGRRALTIEVDRENRHVIQIRGKYNRSPSRIERAWIMEWAEAVGVEL